MIIEFDQYDIEKIFENLEFIRKIPMGNLRIHTFLYDDSKVSFRVDYPGVKNVLCAIDEITISGEKATARLDIPNSAATRILVKTIAGLLPTALHGVELQFPDVKIDISLLELPVTLRKIEMLPQSIRITADAPHISFN